MGKLNNDETWTMRNGKKIKVGDMDEEHARNSLRLMLRNLREGKIKFAAKEDSADCDATEADIY